MNVIGKSVAGASATLQLPGSPGQHTFSANGRPSFRPSPGLCAPRDSGALRAPFLRPKSGISYPPRELFLLWPATDGGPGGIAAGRVIRASRIHGLTFLEPAAVPFPLASFIISFSPAGLMAARLSRRPAESKPSPRPSPDKRKTFRGKL